MAIIKGWKKEIINNVGVVVDGLYNNGKYLEIEVNYFFPPLTPRADIDLIREMAFASKLVSPIMRIDIDTGDSYQDEVVRLSYKGVIEMKRYGSFNTYRKSWRNQLFRFGFTFNIFWTEAKNILSETKVMLTLILAVLALWSAIFLQREYLQKNKIPQMQQQIDSTKAEVDSLINTLNVNTSKGTKPL